MSFLHHLTVVHRLQQEADCKREMMDIKFLADTKMADSKRELEMQKASFNQEVNTKVRLSPCHAMPSIHMCMLVFVRG